MGTLIDLTKSEYEVMDIIWSSDGDLMLSEIQPLLEKNIIEDGNGLPCLRIFQD